MMIARKMKHTRLALANLSDNQTKLGAGAVELTGYL